MTHWATMLVQPERLHDHSVIKIWCALASITFYHLLTDRFTDFVITLKHVSVWFHHRRWSIQFNHQLKQLYVICALWLRGCETNRSRIFAVCFSLNKTCAHTTLGQLAQVVVCDGNFFVLKR